MLVLQMQRKKENMGDRKQKLKLTVRVRLTLGGKDVYGFHVFIEIHAWYFALSWNSSYEFLQLRSTTTSSCVSGIGLIKVSQFFTFV